MKKITKATLKSFIRKNAENLFCYEKSSFDGMVDGVTENKGAGLEKVDAEKIDLKKSCNLINGYGIQGLCVAGGGQDLFTHYENHYFVGIEIYNCCGTTIIATRK